MIPNKPKCKNRGSRLCVYSDERKCPSRTLLYYNSDTRICHQCSLHNRLYTSCMIKPCNKKECYYCNNCGSYLRSNLCTKYCVNCRYYKFINDSTDIVLSFNQDSTYYVMNIICNNSYKQIPLNNDSIYNTELTEWMMYKIRYLVINKKYNISLDYMFILQNRALTSKCLPSELIIPIMLIMIY